MNISVVKSVPAKRAIQKEQHYRTGSSRYQQACEQALSMPFSDHLCIEFDDRNTALREVRVLSALITNNWPLRLTAAVRGTCIYVSHAVKTFTTQKAQD